MDRILEFIVRSFSYNYSCNLVPITGSIRSDFLSKDCFQHLLSIDISGDVFEVPVTMKEAALHIKSRRYSEICMPIVNNNTHFVITRRTIAPIMRDFLSSKSKSVQAVITSKGDKYYGCPGLILDQDYNPLIVCTCVISDGVVIAHRCRIGNNVFIHQDRLIEKTIFKKFLPTLVTDYANMESKFDGIFIGDINLVIKPVVPVPNKDINEDINKFLVDNISDII